MQLYIINQFIQFIYIKHAPTHAHFPPHTHVNSHIKYTLSESMLYVI